MEDLIPLFLASCVIFLVLALLGGKTGMCRQRMTIPCAESARILASWPSSFIHSAAFSFKVLRISNYHHDISQQPYWHDLEWHCDIYIYTYCAKNCQKKRPFAQYEPICLIKNYVWTEALVKLWNCRPWLIHPLSLWDQPSSLQGDTSVIQKISYQWRACCIACVCRA